AATLVAAPAVASPRVPTMVVARSGATFGPRTVAAGAAHVNRCAVAAGTPLAALAWLHRAGGPAFAARGDCSALYVFQVGRDRARAAAGRVHKLRHRLGTAAAGDPSGPVRQSPPPAAALPPAASRRPPAARTHPTLELLL